MPEIRCVLFDLGWTLLEPVSGDWTFTNAFLEMFPADTYGSYEDERWQTAFRRAYVPLADNPRMKDVGEQIRRYTDFYSDLVRFAGYKITPGQARLLAKDISANDSNMYLLATAQETLARLKKEGYRLGVISDTWPNIETQLEHLGITGYFDQLTYSYCLGLSKPDPGMFRDAVNKAGMAAAEIVFVDDLARNLAAAEECGMHGVLSLAHAGTKPDPRFPSVRRPADIFAVLAGMKGEKS